MVAPLVVGISVAAFALGGRYLVQAWQAFKTRPIVPRVRRFYEGGFEHNMTRRETALILGVRLYLAYSIWQQLGRGLSRKCLKHGMLALLGGGLGCCGSLSPLLCYGVFGRKGLLESLTVKDVRMIKWLLM